MKDALKGLDRRAQIGLGLYAAAIALFAVFFAAVYGPTAGVLTPFLMPAAWPFWAILGTIYWRHRKK